MLELGPKRLRGNLSGDCDVARGGIGGNKLYFIDSDRGAFAIAQGFFDLLCDVLPLGSTHGESSHQPGKILDCDFIGKIDAGQTSRRQKLGKTAFRLPTLQRNAIDKKFCARNSQKESLVASLRNGLLQLIPGSLKLGFSTLVFEPVKTDVLYKNVQTMNKGAGRSAAARLRCACGRDKNSPDSRFQSQGNAKDSAVHVTEVIASGPCENRRQLSNWCKDLASQTLVEKPRKSPPTVGLAHWMRRVPEECQRAAVDLAPDPVHDLRVALRRCRSMADGLMAVDPDRAWKDMKKAGRTLFRSLGELRDVQVMMDWVRKLGPADDSETQALLALLTTREQEQKTVAAQAVRSFDLRQWRKWSRELPRRAARIRPGSIVFQHLALERWTAAHELHRRALRNRSQIALHQLRIGIKRFRYIVENFLPQQHAAWSSDLKELQDLLGDIHDLDVLWLTATQVNAFASPESRERWHAIVTEAREKRIARYRERMVGPASLWNVWRAELPQGKQVQAAAMARLKLWASMLDPDFPHSRRVGELAGQVFDGLGRLGLATTSPNQDLRSILVGAAWMHDVGRSKHEKGHHKLAYRMIARLTPPLGRTATDLRLMAAVARFHRGELPQSRHKALQEFAVDQRRIVLQLAAILRFANALDGASHGQIQRVQVASENGHLLISAAGYSAWSRSAEAIAGASYLLELVLRRPVLVKPLKVSPNGNARAHKRLPSKAS